MKLKDKDKAPESTKTSMIPTSVAQAQVCKCCKYEAPHHLDLYSNACALKREIPAYEVCHGCTHYKPHHFPEYKKCKHVLKEMAVDFIPWKGKSKELATTKKNSGKKDTRTGSNPQPEKTTGMSTRATQWYIEACAGGSDTPPVQARAGPSGSDSNIRPDVSKPSTPTTKSPKTPAMLKSHELRVTQGCKHAEKHHFSEWIGRFSYCIHHKTGQKLKQKVHLSSEISAPTIPSQEAMQLEMASLASLVSAGPSVPPSLSLEGSQAT
jgi:hypothetical protein